MWKMFSIFIMLLILYSIYVFNVHQDYFWMLQFTDRVSSLNQQAHWKKYDLHVTFYKKTLWPLLMDGVQLPQGWSHFEEAVSFLPLSSQKFLVLILATSEGWKSESTLKPPSGFKHGTLRLEIQPLNH